MAASIRTGAIRAAKLVEHSRTGLGRMLGAKRGLGDLDRPRLRASDGSSRHELHQTAVEQREHVARDLFDRAVGPERQPRTRRHLVERLPAALLAEHDPETGIRDPVTIALTPGSPLGEDRGGSLAFDEHDWPRNPECGRERQAIGLMAERGIDDCASVRGERLGRTSAFGSSPGSRSGATATGVAPRALIEEQRRRESSPRPGRTAAISPSVRSRAHTLLAAGLGDT
jgi:hypothetical protein